MKCLRKYLQMMKVKTGRRSPSRKPLCDSLPFQVKDTMGLSGFHVPIIFLHHSKFFSLAPDPAAPAPAEAAQDVKVK